MNVLAGCATLGDLCRESVSCVTNARALLFAALAQVACSVDALAQRPEAFDSSRANRWEVELRNRAFLIPERVVQGLAIQPTLGVWWHPTSHWTLGVDAQTVDNSGPGRQGTYDVSRTVPQGGSGNFLQEITYAARFDLWPARSNSAWSATLSWSRGVRSYFAIDRTTHDSIWGNRRRDVPALDVRYEHRWPHAKVGGGAAVAWMARDDALYLRALPGETRRFGPLAGGIISGNLRLTDALSLNGRAFAPVMGNNTIDRTSGRPARALAYDAGAALALSPFVMGEVFVSNALGNTGALALIADREYRALGTGLRVFPGATSAPTPRKDDSHTHHAPIALTSVSPPWLEAHAFDAHVRRASNGWLAFADWAPVPGMQGGIFLDYLDGTRDEGELGASLRLSLLEQTMRGRPRLGLVVSGSRTNNPLVNFLSGSWEEIIRLGLPKGGFNFGDENAYEGRLYVITVATPVEWSSGGGANRVRVVPTAAYVQRSGVQLAGLSLGGERDLAQSLTLGADVGFAVGKGNLLLRNGRAHAVPFGLSASWHPAGESGLARVPFSLHASLSNRAGASPFHTLRVRADHAISVGLGATIGLR